jgi:hypothetical protein
MSGTPHDSRDSRPRPFPPDTSSRLQLVWLVGDEGISDGAFDDSCGGRIKLFKLRRPGLKQVRNERTACLFGLISDFIFRREVAPL